MSDISCDKVHGELGRRRAGLGADIDNLLRVPGFGIVFYDSSLC